LLQRKKKTTAGGPGYNKKKRRGGKKDKKKKEKTHQRDAGAEPVEEKGKGTRSSGVRLHPEDEKGDAESCAEGKKKKAERGVEEITNYLQILAAMPGDRVRRVSRRTAISWEDKASPEDLEITAAKARNKGAKTLLPI